MGMKLHRGQKNMFRRRHTAWLRPTLTAVGCVALIGAGILLAKVLIDQPDRPAPAPAPSGTAGSSSSASGNASSAAPTSPTVPDSSDTAALRGFYLTSAQLVSSDLADRLDKAKAAGFTALLFDAKDETGILRYASETELAKRARTVADTALTTDRLKEILALCRERGMTALPRVYAFRDTKAPVRLTEGRVKLAGNSGILWLDNKKANGGKPWLNPYADEARSYVLSLCQELEGLGFDTVMLDGVQFPDRDSRADYGDSSLTALSKSDMLAQFIDEAGKALKNPPIVAMSGTAALGSDTAGYEGNPLGFGAKTAAPHFLTDTLGDAVSFDGETVTPSDDPVGALRLALAQTASYCRIKNLSVTLMPFVSANRQQGDAVKKVLADAGITSYIVYDAAGNDGF